MVIYREYDKGDCVEVDQYGDWVSITHTKDVVYKDTLTLTRDEAIAAARAILAHYKEPV